MGRQEVSPYTGKEPLIMHGLIRVGFSINDIGLDKS